MSHSPDDFAGASSGDPMNDVPLFREIQRVLLSSPGPVNWELARQVGIATASWGADDPAPTEEDRRGLDETVRAAELAVAGFTGLPTPSELADVQAVRRGQWVVPNIAAFERDWSLPPVEFRAWVALHEVTHRFEFARSWVRPHFLGLVKDLVEHAELDLSGIERQLETMDFSNPEAMSEAFEGMGNFFGESSDPEQRLRIARVQAFMTAAEGYGDHVMDSVGRTMLSSFARIDEAMVRYREGRHGDEALERLLGLEMKRDQYRVGREFCDRVAELTDEATLSRMWESAEALPSMPELEEPTLWLARMA